MANFDGTLNPAAGWPDVPQLGTSAIARGGPGGPMNAQAEALAARAHQLMRLHFERAAVEIGYTLADGSFERGATITSSSQVLLQESEQKIFSWSGVVPPGGMVVAAYSTPTPVGDGGWIDQSSSSLNSKLLSIGGAGMVGSGTYAQIRAYSGPSSKIECLGRSNIFDHAHGEFYLDRGDSSSPDDDATVLVDAIGRRWKRRHEEKIFAEWWGEPDTDDASIYMQKAINYSKTKGGLSLTLLNREYTLKTVGLVVDGFLNLNGVLGSTIVNNTPTDSAMYIGTDANIWNGFKATVSGVRFTSKQPASVTNAHGIVVKAMLADVRHCIFSHIRGSGFWGDFCQYSHIEHCSFNFCDRYGIEIYSRDWNLYMSGDVIINGTYENMYNTLGGMYLEVGNSVISKNTHTNLPIGIKLKGLGNILFKNTFENQEDVTYEQHQVYIIPVAGHQNTLQGNSYFGAGSKIYPLEIDASGDGTTILRDETFIENPVGAYVINQGDLPVVLDGQNKFANAAHDVVSSGHAKCLQKFNGKVSNIAVNGSGPFFFSTKVKPPVYGTWQLGITVGGNGNDYTNHRGSRAFLVHYYNNQFSFEALSASKVVGGTSIVDISSIDMSGIVVAAGNQFNGVGSISWTLSQVCV